MKARIIYFSYYYRKAHGNGILVAQSINDGIMELENRINRVPEDKDKVLEQLRQTFEEINYDLRFVNGDDSRIISQIEDLSHEIESIKGV